MRNRRFWPMVALVLVALCLTLGSAGATPLLGIHTYEDWQAAYPGPGLGPIRAVPADELREMILGAPAWPPEYAEAHFATPELLVVQEHLDSHDTGHPALEMRWGKENVINRAGDPVDPVAGERIVAAWDYVYDEDPDLTGMKLEFSIHTPGPSMFFSLNILDEDGNYREWIWHSGDPGEVEPCTWTTVVIDPVTGWSSWKPLHLFTVDTTGQFDLSRVKILRFNENGIWGPDYSHMDPSGEWIWNAWDHVEVTPEPGTMLLLGGGLLGLMARRRKKK